MLSLNKIWSDCQERLCYSTSWMAKKSIITCIGQYMLLSMYSLEWNDAVYSVISGFLSYFPQCYLHLLSSVSSDFCICHICTSLCKGRLRLNIRNFFTEWAIKWEPSAQGSGRVTIPGSVHKTDRHGTFCCGLVGMVILVRRLDLIILEAFSSLDNSWFCELSKHSYCCCWFGTPISGSAVTYRITLSGDSNDQHLLWKSVWCEHVLLHCWSPTLVLLFLMNCLLPGGLRRNEGHLVAQQDTAKEDVLPRKAHCCAKQTVQWKLK